MAAIGAQIHQQVLAVAGTSQTGSRVHQHATLVSFVGQASLSSQLQQGAVAVAQKGRTIPHVHQTAMLVAFSTGVRNDPTQRAWTFDLDGHLFYVLTLGIQQTYVFDLTTEQWAEWKTEGYPIWNAQYGHMWGDRIVACDVQEPVVFELDPRETLDQGFRAVRRVVTGIQTVRQRGGVQVGMLQLSASVQSGEAPNPTMTLRMSDDAGKSFYTFDTLSLDDATSEQDIVFRSLGTMMAPGRVFEIEDFGGPVRIDGADLQIPGLDDDGA